MTGIHFTITSTILWSVYQLSWQDMSEAKHHEKLIRVEGHMNTLASLAMMDFSNLFFGWPVIDFLYWTGIETFEFPSDW